MSPLLEGTHSEPRSASHSLLDLVLQAQRDAGYLLSAREIKSSADALLQFASSVGLPLLIPVTPMAQRLVGAALLMSGGVLEASDDGTIPHDADVLLVDAVAVVGTALRWQRDLTLAMGATSVRCVALDVIGEMPTDIHLLLKQNPER